LESTSIRTALHETGHLLGLEHSGKYNYINSSPFYTLDEYGDNLSVMSAFPSGTLTASQYLFLDWIPQTEVIEFDPLKGLQTFKLKRINAFDQKGSSIVMKRQNGRNVYLSFPTNGCEKCIAVHLSPTGAGSQLVRVVYNTYFDKFFSNLTITILGNEDNMVVFTVK
jgi:hypothetical protein